MDAAGRSRRSTTTVEEAVAAVSRGLSAAAAAWCHRSKQM